MEKLTAMLLLCTVASTPSGALGNPQKHSLIQSMTQLLQAQTQLAAQAQQQPFRAHLQYPSLGGRMQTKKKGALSVGSNYLKNEQV